MANTTTPTLALARCIDLAYRAAGALRAALSEEQRALLPDNPAGLIELSDADLESVEGGAGTWFFCTIWGCAALCTGAGNNCISCNCHNK